LFIYAVYLGTDDSGKVLMHPGTPIPQTASNDRYWKIVPNFVTALLTDVKSMLH